MIPKHILSKSTFMRGCQCPKSLWLYKHETQLRSEITASQQAIFDTGSEVGELARQLFPGGVDATPPSFFEYQQSVLDTTSYISAGHKIIYEAAFQHDGVLAALDILVNDDGWYAYEVKSSTSAKEQFIRDAALQYYVITNSGITLKDIFIVFINNSYVRNGPIDINLLFNRQSVLKEVLKLQPFIKEQIVKLKAVIAGAVVPVTDIGPHCSDPYPCEFTDHCWEHIPNDGSVFDLRGRGAQDTAFDLYAKGILRIEDIPDAYPLKPGQKTQVAVSKNGNIELSRPYIDAFMHSLRYPLYYLDFETFSSAVPDFDGSRPFQQIPFQFSLHIDHGPGGRTNPVNKEDLKHECFLATPGKDPRQDFLLALLSVIGDSGSVIVYNKAFENMILNELSLYFPEYSSRIRGIQLRMVDLMVPFRKKHYYVGAMKGSYSIKGVLPALVPELSYESLEINNGGDASREFYQLQFTRDIVKVEVVRKRLLEYCEMDTWGMVKLVEKLTDFNCYLPIEF